MPKLLFQRAAGVLLLAVCAPCSIASSSLSGSVQDHAKAPVDGAVVTIWIQGAGKHSQTTVAGRYAFTGVDDGDYFLKVERAGMALLYGAVHLGGGKQHEFNLILAKNSSAAPVVKAESSYDAVSSQQAHISKADRRMNQSCVAKQVTQEWPKSVKLTGWEHGVRIAAVIRVDGTFDDIVVLSAATPDLAIGVLSVVRQWRSCPTYLDGKPVEVVTITDFGFHAR
jgi:hypothetical protein